MSHIATVQLEINDLVALKEACRELGFEFVEGQTTYRWYAQTYRKYCQDINAKCIREGRHPEYSEERIERTLDEWIQENAGKNDLPPGFTVDDLGKCTHAIKVSGADFEVGVVQRNGKYYLLADFWTDGGLTPERIGRGAVKLRQSYTVQRIRHEARRQGKNVRVERLNDRVRVTLT